MFRNIAGIFQKKIKEIESDSANKFKIDEILSRFIKEEILKNIEINYKLSHTLNKGIIRIEIDNRLIAQEVALRIRVLENKLRDGGINFKKLLI